MRSLNSLVSKLWLTIILMVTAVLIILTLVLIFFFRSYVFNTTETILEEDVNRVGEVLLTEHDIDSLGNTSLLQEDNLIILYAGDPLLPLSALDEEIYNRMNTENLTDSTFIIDDLYNSMYMIKTSSLTRYFDENLHIIMYRDLDAVNQSISGITIIMFFTTGILIIGTTIFAFLLLNRITRPLINLKTAAYNTSRGKYKPLEVRSRDEIGELTLAFNKMNRDIKKNIEAVLHEKNLREEIFSSMEEGVLYFDTDAELIYSNAKGNSIYTALSSNSHEKEMFLDNVLNIADTKTPQIERLNMSNHHYQVSYTAVVSDNMTYGTIVLIRDITEIVKTEAMRADFIANVSHELKTPMVMLSGYSEAILDGIVTEPEEVNEMIKIIKDESDRMNRLVNELITIARMDSGSDLMNIEGNDLMGLIKEITMKFKHALHEKEIDLEIDTVSKRVFFDFDYGKIEQVINNLIDNAIRYTEPGDKITLTVRDAEDEVVFSVADTGIGIKEEHQDRIFERFYKVDESRTRGKHGTGLGLYIVSSIIKRHQGKIELYSEPGVGTTFEIILPKNNHE
ncbi:HAMP domain-containing sensor histidine kinase [Lacicoccus alkaliphilus]|uniref:histidine kinase n=1 Tax=Lacicoccus alkaliphilus DSM 16010 TaxID=1123231 RepID=A0A1M7BCM4_9BACL|nr:ATP-binding protein [Salinicoccus alkaliphilus]SHL52671.1 two-component system, OmpR family, sensor histidine kinase ResE [Salinicoccus alkaliphilus DSM 16010]